MLSQKRPRPDSSSAPPGPKLDEKERKIYTLIKATESSGMWTADMRKEAGMTQNVLEKILKSLVGKRLIKNVISIKSKSKKIYMASEFEPSKEISGGAWYQDGNLDTEMIQILRQLCSRYIDDLKGATADMVLGEIKRTGAFMVELTLQQILEILRIMVLDKEIEEVRSTGKGEFAHIPKGRIYYRRIVKGKEGAGGRLLESIPCMICPRIDECTPDGVIKPINCKYYQKWLEF